MKSFKIVVLATAVSAGSFPISAGAFGFGASRFEYMPLPSPYGSYAPPPQQGQSRPYAPAYGQVPPYGPPPGARNVTGMWGSGPGMSWGSSKEEREAWLREVERRRKPHWRYTKDWVYISPYAQPPKSAPSK